MEVDIRKEEKVERVMSVSWAVQYRTSKRAKGKWDETDRSRLS